MGAVFVFVGFIAGGVFVAGGILHWGWQATLGGLQIIILTGIFELLYKIRAIVVSAISRAATVRSEADRSQQ